MYKSANKNRMIANCCPKYMRHTPTSDQKGDVTIPFDVAHDYIAYIVRGIPLMIGVTE